MGYFAIAMNDTPAELISTIKANLELYIQENKDNKYNYLLDMIQGDLEKLENLHLNKDEIESPKLCYPLSELQDPKIFQESLDTLNNLDVNVFTGEVKLKKKEENGTIHK